MKKYFAIVLALILLISPSKQAEAFEVRPQHYFYLNILGEVVSGSAHAARILSINESNVNKIKERALVACITNLLSALFKIATQAKLANELNWFMTGLSTAKDFIEGINAMRMYKNANTIARTSGHKKLFLSKTKMLALLGINRTAEIYQNYHNAQEVKNSLPGFGELYNLIVPFFTNGRPDVTNLVQAAKALNVASTAVHPTIVALFTSLLFAIYEHGYYDSLQGDY